MKNTLKHILSIIFVSVFFNTAFGAETIPDLNSASDGQKTISQLNAEIKAINTEVINTLKETDLNLNYFLKNNLTKSDLDDLNHIINTYNTNTLSIKEVELIENKKNLYSSLAKYIDTNKIDEYMNFVKNDANKIKQSLTAKETIPIKEEIRNNKIEAAKEKIAENNEIIKTKISNQIDIKLSLFKENPDFKKLDTDLKTKVVDGIIVKIDNQIRKFEIVQNKTSTLTRKIEIYDLLRNKLIEFKKSL